MDRRRWSVLLTRDGTTTSRRFRVLGRNVFLGVGGVFLAVAAAAFWWGYTSGSAAESARAQRLADRVDSLTLETARVAELAALVSDLEANYDRLREVMGGDVAPSARDILLPPSGRPASRDDDAPSTSLPSLWPLVEAGFITRTFGDSVPGEGPHEGLDIAVPVGSYVRASAAGRVERVGEDEEYGKFVRIRHENDIHSLYAHMAWTFVSAGDSVEAGEVIALSGNTGRSSAPHLHLEIERGGTAVDPLPFVSGGL